MQFPVKSKFILPQIPDTLVHDFLQTNPKSPLSWAPWIILPWLASLLPLGVRGGRTTATGADQAATDQGPAPPTPHQGPATHEEVVQPPMAH